jgi:NitT/TauT family transport system permease protein
MILIMNKQINHTYAKVDVNRWPIPNYWDIVALLLVVALICGFGMAAKAMSGHYHLGQVLPISLKPSALPYYALCSVLRMFVALACSLLFTFVFGTWAAKSRQAERLIIPAIDVLQSVPVLGFLSITVVGFIALFKGSMLGPECAAIFAIFAAQVWNMTLSLYQSLRTVPEDLIEAGKMFQLSPWQRYWRIEIPFAMPGLLWNTMMSMSGSWVFLVASEAITVAGHHITLPGVGSYIALAIAHADKAAIAYVIIAMFIVIALYDQVLFRPLVAWAEKFKVEESGSEDIPESWLLNLFQRARFMRFAGIIFEYLGDVFVNAKIFRYQPRRTHWRPSYQMRRITVLSWNVLITVLVLVSCAFLGRYVYRTVPMVDTLHVVYLGFATAVRVTALIVISSIIWVPIGVWIGMRPRVTKTVQPILQFLAAFPANLLFPIVVIAIVRYHLNVNIWTSPLMILGTQWYILFNVIAGTSSIPKNMHQAVGSLCVTGWLKWRKFILPAIFPFYITGAITAAGGAWNISIIAEAVSWGHTHLYATGLGAYIDKVYTAGDFPRLALGIAVMSLYVLVINRVLWRPLYNMADRKFRIR